MDERSEVVKGALSDERVAYNEVTSRRVNEAIEAGRVSRDGFTGFVCECGQLGCNSVIELEIREYEAVREGARRFIVVSGHESDFEFVLQRGPSYAVVAKLGEAGELAESTDPRSEDR